MANVTGGAVQSTSQPQVVQEEGEEGEGDERGEEQSRWRGEETIEEDEMEVVQCVCGATSETGSEYVQCEKCRVWLHSHCVSFQSSKHSTFVCIRCLLDEVCMYMYVRDFCLGSCLVKWLFNDPLSHCYFIQDKVLMEEQCFLQNGALLAA